jgi:hypothetical protein
MKRTGRKIPNESLIIGDGIVDRKNHPPLAVSSKHSFNSRKTNEYISSLSIKRAVNNNFKLLTAFDRESLNCYQDQGEGIVGRYC